MVALETRPFPAFNVLYVSVKAVFFLEQLKQKVNPQPSLPSSVSFLALALTPNFISAA